MSDLVAEIRAEIAAAEELVAAAYARRAELIRAQYAAGESTREIGEIWGVSSVAVVNVIDPGRRKRLRARKPVGKPDPSADWWTTSDVAAYLGVRISTVSSYHGRGQMPKADKKVGRTYVWKPERIVTWRPKTR